MTENITYRPIGIIRSEHLRPEATPIQSAYAGGRRGRVEILPQYAEGLRDLDGFSHIYLLYDFHREQAVKLIVTPYLEDLEHGVFATRAPCRPNRLGLSIVTLVSRQGTVLYLDGLDVLDGTPLLDIKPYVGRFDAIANTRDGWQAAVDEETARQRGKRDYER